MTKNNTIQPELPGGFRDYLPEEMIPRRKMLGTIERTFEKFGFLPLDTPALEKEEILTGNDENFRMHIYRASLKNSNEKLALRFDLTVPLARVISSNLDKLSMPFKRYQVGRVWRGERPQAGRFREFTQFDADIVGSKNLMADAEIIALIYETMVSLGFSRFLIQVNNRKILNGLPDYAGYSEEKNHDVLRILDKLYKIDWPDVERLLLNNNKDEDGAAGVGLNKQQVQAIKNFVSLKDSNHLNILNNVQKIMAQSKIALEGIEELSQVTNHLIALGVPKDKWVIDLSVVRGLGYYTGPVFETILTDMPYLGSVFSGGRYDGLVNRFLSNPIPATGASVGVDRLFVAMKEMNILKIQKTLTQVLILNIDSDLQTVYQKIATQLRRENIASEIYFGQEKTLKGQISYAVKNEFPFVIILGQNEMKQGTIQLKNIKEKSQTEIRQEELIAKIKQYL